VQRLASVLWRLRRATGIEAGLFVPGCDSEKDLAGSVRHLAALPTCRLDRLSRYECLAASPPDRACAGDVAAGHASAEAPGPSIAVLAI
jgi:hypothetical protein